MKRFFKLLVLLGLLTLGVYYYLYYSSLNYQLDPDGTNQVSVTVPNNSIPTDIAALLKDEGLIKTEFAFIKYLKDNELDGSLKAGQYYFSESQTLRDIVDALVDGQTGAFKVTLLEGWTAQQMANELESLGLTTVDTFMGCVEQCSFDFDLIPGGYLEGYLYPDTYFVDPATYSDQAFIERLISNFESKLSEEDLVAIESSGKTLEQIIIMASIVEREERIPSEKPVVAGILWNRLDSGIGLYADATTLYALGRTNGSLTAADLSIDSPYNTRKNWDLPPTPISNPSIETIRATIFPEETSYLYYLHDSEGNVHYAETLEGHNINKANHL